METPVKDDPILPILPWLALLVGVEPTCVSILVEVPDMNPRSWRGGRQGN